MKTDTPEETVGDAAEEFVQDLVAREKYDLPAENGVSWGYLWHGWALRDAFYAGARWVENLPSVPSERELTVAEKLRAKGFADIPNEKQAVEFKTDDKEQTFLDRVLTDEQRWNNAYHAFRELATWGETQYVSLNNEDRELALSIYRRARRGDSTPSARGDSAILEWLDKNTTFYDVAPYAADSPNVPTLASVSKRIWYHATDDQLSWPFSKVIEHTIRYT